MSFLPFQTLQCHTYTHTHNYMLWELDTADRNLPCVHSVMQKSQRCRKVKVGDLDDLVLHCGRRRPSSFTTERAAAHNDYSSAVHKQPLYLLSFPHRAQSARLSHAHKLICWFRSTSSFQPSPGWPTSCSTSPLTLHHCCSPSSSWSTW